MYKVKVAPWLVYAGTKGGRGYSLALEEVECVVSTTLPAALPPKLTQYPLYRGRVRKISPPPNGTRSPDRTVRSVVSIPIGISPPIMHTDKLRSAWFCLLLQVVRLLAGLSRIWPGFGSSWVRRIRYHLSHWLSSLPLSGARLHASWSRRFEQQRLSVSRRVQKQGRNSR